MEFEMIMDLLAVVRGEMKALMRLNERQLRVSGQHACAVDSKH